MRFSPHQSGGGVVKLTPAEAAVVAQAVRGLTNREIARTLRKSELTVRNQLTAVYRKLGLKRRLHLIAQFRG